MMSEHLLSYNERQNCKLAMAWYERIDETVHSTRACCRDEGGIH